MKIGNHYNWKHDKRNVLVYLGKNLSGNGMWHQFAKVETPTKVWCEILDNQLSQIEESEG